MSKEVDTYKLFRQLQEREKRKNPYKFYDKDELIDEILKLEDKIEEVREFIYKCNDGKQGINYSGCSKLLDILDKGE